MSKRKVLATDNDAAVAALKSEEFLKMKDGEAVEVALAIQQILRGNNAILENQERLGDQLRKLRERMDAYDQAAKSFNDNSQKYIEDVLSQAMSKKLTGDAAEKVRVSGMLMLEEEIKNAKAKNATTALAFEQELARMPMVEIVSPGVLETVMVQGQPTSTIIPEVIRIKHKQWVLPPGQLVSVPLVVAQAVENRRQSERETQARQAALSKNMEVSRLNEEMNKINVTYKSNTDAVPGL